MWTFWSLVYLHRKDKRLNSVKSFGERMISSRLHFTNSLLMLSSQPHPNSTHIQSYNVQYLIILILYIWFISLHTSKLRLSKTNVKLAQHYLIHGVFIHCAMYHILCFHCRTADCRASHQSRLITLPWPPQPTKQSQLMWGGGLGCLDQLY